ncbi:hypothetical protein DB347_09570 [Opitutaceae bacterium EW11]|nr:hypothetical protein DB347_09570 [Opitutaceae bacterium EW11]
MRAVAIIVVISVVAALVWANWPIPALPAGTKADRIVITKSSRTLDLVRAGQTLRSYRVSLGKAPAGPKEREGDGKTPEGLYRITEHKRNSSFHRALRISYPEKRDIQRAARAGVSSGSDIMIHGIRTGLGAVGRMHRVWDWTAGCIAVTDSEIEQIWSAVDDGTVVELRP